MDRIRDTDAFATLCQLADTALLAFGRLNESHCCELARHGLVEAATDGFWRVTARGQEALGLVAAH